MFMPVHVRKRGDHLKPATVAHLFGFAGGQRRSIGVTIVSDVSFLEN
jgi:hypothetical protein